MPNSNIQLVERLNKAAEAKDFEMIKSLLHPEYTLKDPMMSINSPKEFLEMMKDCPFECKMENVKMFSDGNKVVQTLDMVMTSPVAYRSRVCDVLTIEDGKVRSEELFYDTAQIPEEAKALGEQSMNKNKKKAA